MEAQIVMFPTTPTCLLCNNYFDRKPLIGGIGEDAGGGGGSEPDKEFKEGFTLFSKRLKIKLKGSLERELDPLAQDDEENNGTGGGSEDLHPQGNLGGSGSGVDGDAERFGNGHPCCGECFMALVELLRCEEIIRETRARQQVLVEKLKSAVSGSRDRECRLDKDWVKVRMQLVNCINGQQLNGIQQLENDQDQEENIFMADNFQLPDNAFDLDPLDSPPGSSFFPETNFASTVPEDDEEMEPGPEDVYEEPPVKRRRGRPKKGSNSKSSISTPSSKSNRNIAISSSPPQDPQRCFVLLTRVNIGDFPHLKLNGSPFSSSSGSQNQKHSSSRRKNQRNKAKDVELKMQQSISKILQRDRLVRDDIPPPPPQTRVVADRPPPSPPKLKKPTKKESCASQKQLFYYINEDILLFLRTPIRFSQVGFTCLEPNCSHFSKGSDYFTFENMKNHILKRHGPDKSLDTTRDCPICEQSLASGNQLRRHILNEHISHGGSYVYPVACESCWKTMPEYRYPVHAWQHKNEEEKAAMIAGGEKIHSALKRKVFYNYKRKNNNSSVAGYMQFRNLNCDTCNDDVDLQNNSLRFQGTARSESDNKSKATEATKSKREFEDEKKEWQNVLRTARSTRPKKFLTEETSPDISAESEPEVPLNEDSDSDYQPTFDEGPPGRTPKHSKKKKSVNFRSDVDEKSDSSSDEDHDLQTTQKGDKRKRNRYRRMFYYINQEILLFLCTPIKCSPTGFTCLEPNCLHFAKGTNYFAFENMKEHVIQCHQKNYADASVLRQCPICDKEVYGSDTSRRHILYDHTTVELGQTDGHTVICESCWKPVTVYRYLCHVWLHKNEEEKASAIEKNEIPSNERTRLKRMKNTDRATATLQSPQTRKLNVTKYPNDTAFVLINEEFLLFICTPVKYTRSGFHCTEQGCSFCAEGSDYFGFDKMKSHVIECHEKDYESVGISRSCPICEKTFHSGGSIRLHILNEHTSFGKHHNGRHVVVCESCWRPMFAASYPCHVWRHKSYQEKTEAILSGNIEGKLKFKLGLSTSRCHDSQNPEDNEEILPKRTPRRVTKCKKAGREDDFTSLAESGSEENNKCSDSDEDYQPTSDCQEDDHQEKKKCLKQKKSKAYNSKTVTKDEDEDDVNFKRAKAKKRLYLEETSFKQDKLFFLLSEDVLFYKDVLIKMYPTEFFCLEKECGAKIFGSGYNAFEEVRSHVHRKKRASNFLMNGRQTCPICQVEFAGVVNFRNHIFNEHSPPALCTSCLKPVESYDTMSSHSQLHMNEEEKLEAITGANTSAWHRGIRYYSGKKNWETFPCGVCPKQFSSMHLLRAHKVSHLPRHLRPHFDCPDCGLQVLSKRALQSHIERAHRPDLVVRKRTCHICSSEFHYRDGAAYRRHVRSHTGERPWVCELCGKGFFAKEYLTRHTISAHGDVYHYQCEFCPMKYKIRNHLRRHQKNSHKEFFPDVKADEGARLPENRPGFIGPKIAYPCEHCGKLFQLRSRMTKHVKKAHPDMVEELVATFPNKYVFDIENI